MENSNIKSLVADYDSSSNDEQLDEASNIEEPPVTLASASQMLNINTNFLSTSVFTNPYQKAEDYEQSVLEKHVKMTTIKDPEKQSKKMCFKFKKGKCRLGDKCNFLHQNPMFVAETDKTLSDEEDKSEKKSDKSKKRCGLKDDLIPPKKYMKTFNKTK